MILRRTKFNIAPTTNNVLELLLVVRYPFLLSSGFTKNAIEIVKKGRTTTAIATEHQNNTARSQIFSEANYTTNVVKKQPKTLHRHSLSLSSNPYQIHLLHCIPVARILHCTHCATKKKFFRYVSNNKTIPNNKIGITVQHIVHTLV
jgi:hypothetical protein